MLQSIIIWILAYALCEMVEPAYVSPLGERKRALSGFLQVCLIAVAILAILREIAEIAIKVWG